MNDDLIFEQLEIGPLQNLIYLVGSRSTGEAAIVDPAWDINGMLEKAAHLSLKIKHIVATHAHPDHVGGSFMGMQVPGVAELLEIVPSNVHVHVHPQDVEALKALTGVVNERISPIEDGGTLKIGSQTLEFIHTPGHSPGSVCILVEGQAITGDTLFVGACGRVDLPGGDPAALYDSLNITLKALPDDTVIFPGHSYGGRTSTIAEEKRSNYTFQVPTKAQWLRMMGAPA